MSAASQTRPKARAVIGVILALGLAAAMVMMGTPPAGHPVSAGRVLYEAGWWLVAAFALIWALRAEGLTLSALGVRRPGLGTLGWGAAFAAAQIGAVALCYFVLFPALGLPSRSARVTAIAHEPIWLMALLTARAGIVEEWLFRFFAIGRMAFVTRNRWAASLVPGAIFVALHAQSWALDHLIPVTIVTVLLTIQYWWRRDFWGNALSHFLTDFIPFAGAALAAAHPR